MKVVINVLKTRLSEVGSCSKEVTSIKGNKFQKSYISQDVFKMILSLSWHQLCTYHYNPAIGPTTPHPTKNVKNLPLQPCSSCSHICSNPSPGLSFPPPPSSTPLQKIVINVIIFFQFSLTWSDAVFLLAHGVEGQVVDVPVVLVPGLEEADDAVEEE